MGTSFCSSGFLPSIPCILSHVDRRPSHRIDPGHNEKGNTPPRTTTCLRLEPSTPGKWL